MKTINNEIAKYYDENVIKEDNRLSEFSSEFLLTQYLLEKYGVHNQNVLDLGGGTGVYAFGLSENNNIVTLADISKKELCFVKEKAELLNTNIKTVFQNACEYNDSFYEKYDTVLCLGPLYHCKSIDEIESVIENVYKYTKNGGFIFLSFLSKYAKFNKILSNEDNFENNDFVWINEYFHNMYQNTNAFIFERRNKLPITFTTPENLESFFEEKPFNVELISCIDFFSQAIENCCTDVKEHLIELGKTIKLNSGSHVLVVLKKRNELYKK